MSTADTKKKALEIIKDSEKWQVSKILPRSRVERAVTEDFNLDTIMDSQIFSELRIVPENVFQVKDQVTGKSKIIVQGDENLEILSDLDIVAAHLAIQNALEAKIGIQYLST